MAAADILDAFGQFSILTSTYDDDCVDRISHVYTVAVLALFAFVVTGGQYVGNPINCWVPADYTESHTQYAESFCWVKNTYYIPMDEAIPILDQARDSEELTYYQWVPIILLFMAFLFKFPYVIWRLFNGSSGVNLDKIVHLTLSAQLDDPDSRSETAQQIAFYLHHWLAPHHRPTSTLFSHLRYRVARLCRFYCGKAQGRYLVGLYLFIKFLYVVNVAAQFLLLNAFVGDWYSVYGLKVLGSLNQDDAWWESKRFPRVTLCDFGIRQLQNVQNYTVQCVLPINLFNEKIFLFLWFWLILVAVLTIGSFVFWLWNFFCTEHVSYLKNHLSGIAVLHSEIDNAIVDTFANEYLRDDGCFVLRVVARNSNEILLSDLLEQLWRNFCQSLRYNVGGTDESEAYELALLSDEAEATDDAHEMTT